MFLLFGKTSPAASLAQPELHGFFTYQPWLSGCGWIDFPGGI
jgi:hypothetical protein